MTLQTPAPPHVVRAAGSAEFLAMVPHLVGCVPTDSVVLVPFAGRRTAGGLRIDLPPEILAPDDRAQFAATLLGTFTRLPQEVDRAAIVVYTRDPFRDERGRIARAGLVEALIRCLEAADYDLVDALCVAADGWGSYIEPDAPYAARPLDEIAPSRLDWPGGEVPEADQHAGAELPPSDLVERERVGRILRSSSIDPASPDLVECIEDLLVDEDAELGPDDLAWLVQLFDKPLTRDIALEQCAGDIVTGRATWAWQLAWSRGRREVPEGAFRLAGEGAHADEHRLRRGLELAKRAASVAPRDRRAGPLAAAAWLSWALGSSTHAAHFVALAREIAPDHGLAGIVATMVANQNLPEWLYARAGRVAG